MAKWTRKFIIELCKGASLIVAVLFAAYFFALIIHAIE